MLFDICKDSTGGCWLWIHKHNLSYILNMYVIYDILCSFTLSMYILSYYMWFRTGGLEYLHSAIDIRYLINVPGN